MEVLKQSINQYAFKIPFFDNYEVSKDSFTVRNLKNGKYLSPIKSKNSNKYRLCRNGSYYFLSRFDILFLVISSINGGNAGLIPDLKKYQNWSNYSDKKNYQFI